MPYTINNFNGTTFTTLADGVIDRQLSSSIYLIGRNVTGYGGFQNDNFLWLLQNFAAKTEPTNKIQGQTWFDTTTGVLKLKIYEGGQWKNLAYENGISNILTTGATTATGTIIGAWTVQPDSKIISDILTTGATTATGTIIGDWFIEPGSRITSAELTTGELTADQVITGILTAGATTATGTIIGNWSLSAGSKLTSTYADLAENYKTDTIYNPGVVMEFGGTAELTLCQTDMSTKVAGIISTAPAFLLNDQHELEGHNYSIALSGRVPCNVKGKINKGDLLVSGAGGYARAESNPIPGTIVAKAIESYDSEDIGQIEVMVWRG
jgi:hypothetical protein